MQQELAQLKAQVQRLQLFLCAVCVGALSLIFMAFKREESFDVIRAKGIVIEDSAGRDRILIGAPIPASKDRVRTDTGLVRKHWAGQFDKRYMDWYKEYRHSAYGMVVMNEQGFDRVAVGDQLPDPNIGRRMFTNAGVVWNDKDGFERGGLGVNTTDDGQSRSVVGVDAENGEAVHLVALEDGTNAISINTEEGTLMIGSSKKDGMMFENKEAFTGVKYFDKKGKIIWEQELKKPVARGKR